jgi:hypothetical protein
MPRVEMPSTLKGWVAVLGSSIVGFVAGTVSLKWLSDLLR